MKKILIAYGILVLVVIILAFFKFNDGQTFVASLGNLGSNEATVNGQTYKVEVAKDDKARQIGLSGRKSLDQGKGMVFVFDKKGKYSFWMKNTQIPLDIIFINDGKVVHVVKNAIPQQEVQGQLPIYTTPTEANYVLEVNAGEADKYKIKNGDQVTLKGI